MRRWIIQLALAVIIGSIRQNRFFWPLAISLARGESLNGLLAQLASMTDTNLDDLLAKGSFREALRLAIDTYDGPANEGVVLYDSFLGRIEEAAEGSP